MHTTAGEYNKDDGRRCSCSVVNTVCSFVVHTSEPTTMGRTTGPSISVLLYTIIVATMHHTITDAASESAASAVAASSTTTAAVGNSNCDLTVGGAVCLMQNRRVLLPSATPTGLVGRWNFDDAWPTDSSGNGLHAATPALSGVGVGPGGGFSGSFDRSAKDFVPVKIPDDGDRLVSVDSTVTFWLFVVRPPAAGKSAAADCAVFFKGNMSSAAKGADRLGSPSVFISAGGKNTLAFVANGALQHSNARVPVGRWTHVRRCD